MKPRIGLLLGDPTGIGPELTAKLLAAPATQEAADVTVIGDPRIYRQGVTVARVAPVDVPFILHPSDDYAIGAASARAGEYVLETLRLAFQALQQGRLDAIVYAPLNKQAMKLAGSPHADELHYFAALLNYSGTVSELNVCDGLWTSRVTSHIPLRAVADSITADGI